ncbi:MAG: endonuclease/exonuclease/phosphatase family protein [bacterium]
MGLFVGLLAIVGWLVVAGLLVVVAARLVRPDSNLLFIWANAYTFWIYQPAYPIALFALVFRRWWLLGAAGAVVVFHLAWVLPDYRPAQPIPAEALAAPHIRLMTANVYFENPDYAGIAAEIADVDPDVLFLQEFGPRMDLALRDSGVAIRYPYVKIAYENAYFGTALYSKFPLDDVTVVEAGGRPYIRATIQIEGQNVVLYDLHPTSPGLGATIANHWNDGWTAITDAFRDETGLVIAAGDFNLDQHHRWYREIKKTGLISAHEERGRGNATTWPKDRKLRPIRIDQVFHSQGIVCLSIREGRGEGSDHRPVIADLAILGR